MAARYPGRFTQGFVRGKLRADPVLPALLGMAPFGEVVDCGCGRGQLALALLLGGAASSVTGLDLDEAKIAEAQRAAEGLAARFAVADLGRAALPDADTLLLIDLLYQMPERAQEAVLYRAARAARRRVVIRAFDPDRGWRSLVGQSMERVRRVLGGDLGLRGEVKPRPLAALAAPLLEAGFRMTISPCWAGTPLPNVLLVAERP